MPSSPSAPRCTSSRLRWERGPGTTPSITTLPGLRRRATCPNLTLSSLPSQAYLFLHILGVEGPDTDAYTWDADYTQITTTGTTGGTDTDNVHIRGGYRIATLTGDTVGITSTTADRDLVHGLFALGEVTLTATFPEYDLLDDFDRSDEILCPKAGSGRYRRLVVVSAAGWVVGS